MAARLQRLHHALSTGQRDDLKNAMPNPTVTKTVSRGTGSRTIPSGSRLNEKVAHDAAAKRRQAASTNAPNSEYRPA